MTQRTKEKPLFSHLQSNWNTSPPDGNRDGHYYPPEDFSLWDLADGRTAVFRTNAAKHYRGRNLTTERERERDKRYHDPDYELDISLED